ncbi:MAG: glycine--tRNA ligase subunit beta [Selenomonadaceae bacterium]|nr:glycine--tRNA ligase subunit beta [Selenomonadaceae bacterium]
MCAEVYLQQREKLGYSLLNKSFKLEALSFKENSSPLTAQSSKLKAQNFLLEIGTEEIPAHAMPAILEQLKTLAEKSLSEARITFGNVQTLGTPRRLALLVENVAARQADVEDEKRGASAKIAFDADGKPTKAAIGFAKKNNVQPEDLIVRDGYIYAVIHEQGKSSAEIFATLLPKIICDLSFPNNMRWGSLDFKFIRPLRWIVALFGDEIIPFEVANVKSGRTSRGHRFLSTGDFEIPTADNYVDACEKNFVIVDQNKRRDMIVAQINEVAASKNGVAEITDDLLEEVLYLVEYPTALAGEFETKYLELPAEAVITPMRDHQRYFPVKTSDGKLMPLFITIRNGGKDFIDIVQHGNERVLKARLEDAQFFFNEDRKKSLEAHRDKLKTVVFQEGLGSVYEKTERLIKLVEKISDILGVTADERANSIRAAKLSKADLVTGMVTEFTELQGVMGREYAKLDGEPAEVCAAIDEHYMPRFAGDAQPKSTAGKILSLADKIDNIVATFSRGLIPTGSQDPFALRRQALGIVNQLTAARQSVSIREIVDLAMDLLKITDKVGREKIQREVADFMRLRVKNVLSNSTRYDVIDAVLDDADDVFAVTLKAAAVEQFLATPDAVKTIQSFVRVSNLAKKADSTDMDEKLFELDAEKVLFKAFEAVKVAADELIAKKDFLGALDVLKKLSTPIDSFFDSVMVMDENLSVRKNRLALLKSTDELLAKIADFGKIVQ